MENNHNLILSNQVIYLPMVYYVYDLGNSPLTFLRILYFHYYHII